MSELGSGMSGKIKSSNRLYPENEGWSLRRRNDGMWVTYGLETGREYAESVDRIIWTPIALDS